MNLTPRGALELLIFEASICNNHADFGALQERVAQCGRVLGIPRPSLPQYDNLRLALRDARAAATQKVRLS